MLGIQIKIIKSPIKKSFCSCLGRSKDHEIPRTHRCPYSVPEVRGEEEQVRLGRLGLGKQPQQTKPVRTLFTFPNMYVKVTMKTSESAVERT